MAKRLTIDDKFARYNDFTEGCEDVAKLNQIPVENEIIPILKKFGNLYKREIRNEDSKQLYCLMRNMLPFYTKLVKEVKDTQEYLISTYATIIHYQNKNLENKEALTIEKHSNFVMPSSDVARLYRESQREQELDPDIMGEGCYEALEKEVKRLKNNNL